MRFTLDDPPPEWGLAAGTGVQVSTPAVGTTNDRSAQKAVGAEGAHMSTLLVVFPGRLPGGGAGISKVGS